MKKFCPACGAALAQPKNFCPECGESLTAVKPANFSAKQLLLLVGITFILWSSASLIRSKKEGIKPSASAEPQHAVSESRISDGELDTLRKAAQAAPKEIAPQRALAEALAERSLEGGDPNKDTIFELIAVLDAILDLDPKDSQALLNRANLAYNFHSYEKASGFYERFLEIHPEDKTSRTAYASSLTLLGKFDQAEVQLNNILKDDPKNFTALANLFVNYSARGDKDKAANAAQSALAVAPSAEARAKLSDLVDKLSSDTDLSQAQTTESPALEDQPASNSLERFIHEHPIAGPKFVKMVRLDGGIVELRFRNFPMDKMPPFVKEKFLKSVSEVAKLESPASKILRFKDADSGAVMAERALYSGRQ